MPFYCEICYNEVTPKEVKDSEINHGGKVYCKTCEGKIKNRIVGNAPWLKNVPHFIIISSKNNL